MSSESEDQERIAHIEARIAHWKGSPSDGPLYLQDESWLLTRLRSAESERDAALAQVSAVRAAVYDGKYGGDAEWVSLNVRHIVRRPSALSVPVVEDSGDSA